MIASRRTSRLVATILAAAVVAGLAVGGATVVNADARATSISDIEDQISEAEREQRRAEQRREQIEADLAYTDAEIVEADRKLRELEDQMPPLQRALELAEERVQAAVVQQGIIADKLAAAEAQDRAISDQIAEDEDRVRELESLLAAIAREAYKGADARTSLGIVVGSTSTREFVNEFTAQRSAERVQSSTLAALEDIAAVNRNRGARQDAVREYIAELKVEADALVVELEGLRAEAEEAKAEVEALLEEQQELRDYLDSQRERFLEQQRENERQQQALRDQVLDLFEQKKAAQEALRNQQPKDLSRGVLGYPTAVPYVTSRYGMRVHPIYGYSRLHAGTDYRAYCGTPIYASATGTVEWSRFLPGFGNQVMIDHGVVQGNSLMSSYNHLSRFAVSGGQRVARGDVIGYSGTTGSSTACHLHFEVYVNGKTVNPETLVG